jgi:hypothetical protein
MKVSPLHISRLLAGCLVVLIILASGCDLGAPMTAPSLPRDTWVSLGPEGGSVADLVIDPLTPSTLYASLGSGGVFKSTNGGKNWQALPNAPSWTMKLAIDPKTPSTLYAAGFGIFKSMDAGVTWIQIQPSISHDFPFLVLAVDPVTPTTIYTGLADGIKSTDGGKTWDSFKTKNGRFLSQLLIDPQKTDTLYAGFHIQQCRLIRHRDEKHRRWKDLEYG